MTDEKDDQPALQGVFYDTVKEAIKRYDGDGPMYDPKTLRACAAICKELAHDMKTGLVDAVSIHQTQALDAGKVVWVEGTRTQQRKVATGIPQGWPVGRSYWKLGN